MLWLIDHASYLKTALIGQEFNGGNDICLETDNLLHDTGPYYGALCVLIKRACR